MIAPVYDSSSSSSARTLTSRQPSFTSLAPPNLPLPTSLSIRRAPLPLSSKRNSITPRRPNTRTPCSQFTEVRTRQTRCTPLSLEMALLTGWRVKLKTTLPSVDTSPLQLKAKLLNRKKSKKPSNASSTRKFRRLSLFNTFSRVSLTSRLPNLLDLSSLSSVDPASTHHPTLPRSPICSRFTRTRFRGQSVSRLK